MSSILWNVSDFLPESQLRYYDNVHKTAVTLHFLLHNDGKPPHPPITSNNCKGKPHNQLTKGIPQDYTTPDPTESTLSAGREKSRHRARRGIPSSPSARDRKVSRPKGRFPRYCCKNSSDISILESMTNQIASVEHYLHLRVRISTRFQVPEP